MSCIRHVFGVMYAIKSDIRDLTWSIKSRELLKEMPTTRKTLYKFPLLKTPFQLFVAMLARKMVESRRITNHDDAVYNSNPHSFYALFSTMLVSHFPKIGKAHAVGEVVYYRKPGNQRS